MVSAKRHCGIVKTTLDYESSSHSQGPALYLAHCEPPVDEQTNDVNKISQKNCSVITAGPHPPSLTFHSTLYINL